MCYCFPRPMRKQITNRTYITEKNLSKFLTTPAFNCFLCLLMRNNSMLPRLTCLGGKMSENKFCLVSKKVALTEDRHCLSFCEILAGSCWFSCATNSMYWQFLSNKFMKLLINPSSPNLLFLVMINKIPKSSWTQEVTSFQQQLDSIKCIQFELMPTSVYKSSNIA